MSIAEPRSGLGRAHARTLERAPSFSAPAWWHRLGTTPHLLALGLLAALLRVPFLGTALTPDEAGFTLVARQWSPGSSLYGQYWVDRPPLLIALFGLASHWGTPVGLRLLGCLAVFLATFSVGLAARSAAGPRAGFWAAAVAAVGLASPMLGALPVNGELLAAPFIAGAIFCWVESTRRPHTSRLELLAAAGALAAAAVLVKQNMIDAMLFVGAATALELFFRHRSPRSVLSGLVTFTGGALATVLVVLGLAAARGSSVSGIWYAMYPFRLAAADPIQGASSATHLAALTRLGGLELLTLGPVLLAALLAVVVRLRVVRGLDVRVVGPAVLVVAAYDVFSIVAGGSYWTHYLVELIVPTALAAGIVAARGPRLGSTLAAAAVAVSLVLGAASGTHLPQDRGPAIGEAIADVSDPTDTIVSALGDADIVQTSGLHSDYTYLWSLPARTLDPQFTSLAALLQGPDAPTWLVVRGSRTLRTLSATATGTAIQHRYREVATMCGRIVYENDSVDRRTPTAPPSCTTG